MITYYMSDYYTILWKKKILNWIIQWVKSFLKERRFSIIFEKKYECDKHDKCRSLAKILCFIYTIFVFQCESAKYMRATKKITLIEFVNDVNVLTYNTSIKKNCEILKKLHEILTTSFRRYEATFFLRKYELIHFNKSLKKFNMQTMINLKEMQLTFKINIWILELQINTKLKWKF